MENSCPCQDSDPTKAYGFLRQAKTQRSLVDESHFIVSLRICIGCGQPYLAIFFELIDWSEGDDSQARVFLRIDQETFVRLDSMPEPIVESTIIGMKLAGQQVIWSHPRDSEPYVSRIEGPLAWFPHD